MSTRTPSIIAAVLTVILLIVFGVLFLFVEVIALNGASEQQGVAALGISVVCQGIGVILSALLAGWLSWLVISRLNWNQIVAVVVAVIAGTSLGALLSFLSVMIAIPAVGIR